MVSFCRQQFSWGERLCVQIGRLRLLQPYNIVDEKLRCSASPVCTQDGDSKPALSQKIKKFGKQHRYAWLAKLLCKRQYVLVLQNNRLDNIGKVVFLALSLLFPRRGRACLTLCSSRFIRKKEQGHWNSVLTEKRCRRARPWWVGGCRIISLLTTIGTWLGSMPTQLSNKHHKPLQKQKAHLKSWHVEMHV